MSKRNVSFFDKAGLNRSNKLFRRRLISKEKKAASRRQMEGKTCEAAKKQQKIKYEYFAYVKITAPKVFSLIENREKVLAFIKSIRNCFEQKRKVFVLLGGVEIISNDAILILLSNMIQFKSHRIDFNGDFPKNKLAKRLIVDSGFFESLYGNFKINEVYKIKSMNSSIYTHAQKAVAPEISNALIEQASKTVWGEARRCPGVQRTFVELMHNTNNHASSMAGEMYWCLSVTHDKVNKKVCFSFIDFGVGIFRSLDEKKPGDKFYGWKSKFLSVFPLANSNEKILKLILNGELHRTVTNNYYRGKGLPGIKGALDNNKISSLVIISNNVYGNASIDDYHLLNNELPGTFVSWEINEDIINLPWI